MAFRIFNNVFNKDSLKWDKNTWKEEHGMDCSDGQCEMIQSPFSFMLMRLAPDEYWTEVRITLYDWYYGIQKRMEVVEH